MSGDRGSIDLNALNILLKMAVDGIPVVDFSAMSLENKNPLSENNANVKDLADQVYQAFSTIGFVYLKNHGIPQELVSKKRHPHCPHRGF